MRQLGCARLAKAICLARLIPVGTFLRPYSRAYGRRATPDGRDHAAGTLSGQAMPGPGDLALTLDVPGGVSEVSPGHELGGPDAGAVSVSDPGPRLRRSGRAPWLGGTASVPLILG
jgi:hypothetical protein